MSAIDEKKRLPFVGREAEIGQLRDWDGRESRLTVVYGRRRVGKTRLIEEAFASRRMLRFEGIEGQSEAQARQEFLRQCSEQLARPELAGFSSNDWPSLFLLLSRELGAEPCVVLFDEYQWMAGEGRAAVAYLKYAWDKYFLKKNRIQLVLCGSVSSFMVRKVIRSNALYGRIDLEINLQPLLLPEVARVVGARRSIRDRVDMYMVTGGIPYYAGMFDYGRSVQQNVQDLCFTKNGRLVNEYDRIFVSHFNSRPQYRLIVEALSHSRALDRDAIMKRCKIRSGGRASAYLDELVMAGFVEKYPSVDRNNTVREVRYRLRDFYLLYYFTFIQPNLAFIQESERGGIRLSIPDAKRASWQGLAFERVCLAHSRLIARRLGFEAIKYTVGSWYQRGKDGAQLDLVFDRADRVFTCCELKYTQSPVGTAVVDEVRGRIRLLSLPKSYVVDPVLICAAGATDEVAKAGFFSRILSLEEVFGGA